MSQAEGYAALMAANDRLSASVRQWVPDPEQLARLQAATARQCRADLEAAGPAMAAAASASLRQFVEDAKEAEQHGKEDTGLSEADAADEADEADAAD